MAEQVVNRRVNIFIDETAGAAALEKLTKKEQELVAAIERGKKAGKDLTKEMNDLANTRTKIGQLEDVMSGKLLPSVRQAEAAVRKLSRELKNLPADSAAAAAKLQELGRAQATLEQVRQKVSGIDKALDNIQGNRGLASLKDFILGSFLGGGLLGVAEGAISGIQNFFRGAVDEALAAEEATARFKAQLDNLGQQDVFESLTQAAEDFADALGFIDNDDIVGVFEQLINYGKLTETQIKQLTPVIIDFAAKQRIELSEAASVIIKALEGNGKALKTYGIDIKDAKTVTEAFGVVMTELKPKVDGAAQAFGETTAGQIKRTRQEIANMQEDIGTKLLPAVRAFFQSVSGITAWVERLITTGAIAGGETQFGANLRARQEFLDNLAKDFETKSKQQQINLARGQIALVQDLTKQYRAASGQRKKELEQQLKEETALLQRFSDIIRRQPDTRVIGSSGGDSSKNKSGGGKATKDTIKELQERYIEFSNRTEQATQPILAAFREINEQAAKDVQTVKEALRANLITPGEAEQSLQLIERVLNQQRDSLAKRFGMNPERLGTLGGELTVDKLFQNDSQEGARDFGKKVMNSIYEGAAEFVNDTDEDPLEEWLNKWGDALLIWASQVADIFGSISQIRSNQEQADLEREIANNDKRRESAKKLLDQKLISQKEYDRRVAQIDKQQETREREFRKKQFEREKAAQTVQALVNGANAVLSTLSKFGPPVPPNFVGIAAMALTVATTAAQVAAIRSQRAPQFEQGGFIPQGSSHKQGGIALVDNRTGARVGEVEGGEPIISKKVYARNKPLIDSLIAQGSNMSMNVPRINSSMQTVFETGGFIPRGSEVDNGALLAAISTLNERLSGPIMAEVVYGQYESKANRITAIRNQSMIS